MSRRGFILAGVALALGFLVIVITPDGRNGVGAMLDATPTLRPLPDPVLGELDLETVSQLDLNAYPEVPTISDYALSVYQNSVASGNDPHSFIKVGDCMTHNPYFLIPIGARDYDLGTYASLQPVIDYFDAGDPNAFSRESQASAGGFNAASVLDSLWANPQYCESGETPLSCELRIMHPGIALIMFGTNDVFSLSEAQFDFSLRQVVVSTIRNRTLPILSTFPMRPEFPDQSVLFNQIVVQIAQDYDLPLINLWRALQTLPGYGVDPVDTTHMSVPKSGAVCYFVGENLQFGFNVRNLLTLQTLDALLQAAGEG